MRRRAILATIGAVTVGLAFGVAAWAADPVAYLTEIRRKGAAEVRVKPVDATAWQTPQPLLALRLGDQVRASGDAEVVILFHGGGTVTVKAENSPFTVSAAPSQRTAEQLRVVTSSVTEFFLGKQKAPTYRRAATRGEAATIVSPRHTRLLPEPLTFEWEGPEHLRYTVRVLGPDGVVWQQADLPRRPLRYPAGAPPLARGVKYAWELEAPGQPVQRTPFEIVSDEESRTIRQALAVLERDTRQGYSRATVTVMRAAFLFEGGLFAEARRELERAAAADPDEPTLRTMLGHVYDHTGLPGKAAQEFERAKALVGP